MGWRNRGLGVQFLSHAQERANQLGLNGLSLIDYAANTGARRFYERHGFAIIKTCQVTPHPMIRVTGDAYLMHRSSGLMAQSARVTHNRCERICG
jgi:ribosomal protein S18 acetylase RimI-like enzyme